MTFNRICLSRVRSQRQRDAVAVHVEDCRIIFCCKRPYAHLSLLSLCCSSVCCTGSATTIFPSFRFSSVSATASGSVPIYPLLNLNFLLIRASCHRAYDFCGKLRESVACVSTEV